MKKYLLFFITGIIADSSGLFPKIQKHFISPPDTTFLPDGNGVFPTQPLFLLKAMLQDKPLFPPFDIVSLCVNMEHSFLGDLNIAIECPERTIHRFKGLPGR